MPKMANNNFKACSVNGCERNAHWKTQGALGMCNAHYKRTLRYGSPDGGTHRCDNSGECSVDGCARPARSLGMCNAHYLRKSTGVTTDKAMRGDPQAFVESAAEHVGDDCLVWPFSRNSGGYGTIFASKGRTTLVHRQVCEIVNGPAPKEECHAAHSCGNGHIGCVNPAHLRWALPVENMSDKASHGTNLSKARGEAHPRAKLTAADVSEILAARGRKRRQEIADDYGVSISTVKAIYAGRIWRGLEVAV